MEEGNFIFEIDDLNLTGYEYSQLKNICEFDILIKTRFPKLLLVLLDHPSFLQWLETNSNQPTKEEIITKLIHIIHKFAFNYQGNLVHSKIDLKDEMFWKMLVEMFMLTSSESHKPKTMKKKRSVWI